MVDNLTQYKSILQRGVVLFGELAKLYLPNVQAPNDWADTSVAEALGQREGLIERLEEPKLSANYTATLISSIVHYLDNHLLDYTEYPVNNPEKRQRVEYLHAELNALLNDVSSIHNKLI